VELKVKIMLERGEYNGKISATGAVILLKLTNGQFENAKIKVKNAKFWNPDSVGIAIF